MVGCYGSIGWAPPTLGRRVESGQISEEEGHKDSQPDPHRPQQTDGSDGVRTVDPTIKSGPESTITPLAGTG